jgi:diacylglycerol kinase (ATP)
MEIENGGRHDEARALMTTVGIGRRFGGGFYLTSRAEIDDGLFDVCVLHDLGTFGRIRKMLDVIRKRHIGTPGVEYFQRRRCASNSGARRMRTSMARSSARAASKSNLFPRRFP